MKSLLAAVSLLAVVGMANASTMQMSLVERGSDVTFSFDGTIDSTGFLSSGRASTGNLFFSNAATAGIGSTAGSFERFDIAVSGPAFGTGSTTSILGFSSGDSFLVDGQTDSIVLTDGYVSGSQLSGGAILAGTSLGDLGAEVGTYQFSFGNNMATLSVSVAPIPLPAGALLLLGALGGLTLLRRRRN
jgi:hypothetical protein